MSSTTGMLPTPAPAARFVARGRGRRRGRGSAQATAPVRTRAPAATPIPAREESPDEDVYIPEDDQARDEQVVPDQAPPSFIATPVLQDTLACMLNFLEGITQASILPSMSSGSQTRVGGHTPDQQTAT
ncbi:hypothetical protein HAX54_043273, partial [Datura stramonium]|nr:hypothetical protein [Datura stramonium]